MSHGILLSLRAVTIVNVSIHLFIDDAFLLKGTSKNPHFDAVPECNSLLYRGFSYVRDVRSAVNRGAHNNLSVKRFMMPLRDCRLSFLGQYRR